VKITYLYFGDDVRVHKAGCRDIERECARRRPTTRYSSEASSKQDAANNFYSDFVESGEMTEQDALSYTTFLPCTNELR
jgi:hypothetical protein